MNRTDIQSQLIQRVKDNCPGFVTVSDAWFMSPLDNLGTDLPGCFIYRINRKPIADIETLRPRQQIRLLYGFWIVCAATAFEDRLYELDECLWAWSPGENYGLMTMEENETNQLKGNTVWWLNRYSVDTTLFNRG